MLIFSPYIKKPKISACGMEHEKFVVESKLSGTLNNKRKELQLRDLWKNLMADLTMCQNH